MGSPGSCGTQPGCNAELIKGCASKRTTQVLSFDAPTISGNEDSSRRPQERRLVFFASQQRAETNDTHAKNRLSKQPQPAARNFWQRCSDTNRTTRRRGPATETALANNDQGHRAVTFGFQLENRGGHGSGAPPCYVVNLREVYKTGGSISSKPRVLIQRRLFLGRLKNQCASVATS